MKSPFGAGQRTQYHHGNLKDALIEAARVLVAERGPEGLTLAEAAKRVGVTGAAPYRHFSDRQDLLRQLGKRGFEMFGATLAAAYGTGAPDAISALRRMGVAYLHFAKTEPGFYSAMFAVVPVETSGTAAFEGLLTAARETLRETGGSIASAPELAMKIWAVSHGIAALEVAGFLPHQAGNDAQTLLEDATMDLVKAATTRP